MDVFEKKAHNRVRRIPERGIYQKSEIYAILDEGLYCHVGFSVDGRPYTIPTLYARVGSRILLHGSRASRLMKHIQGGHPICVAVTLIDGLVLARSAFHHSLNYRSVLIFGWGESIESDAQKLEALRAFSEHLIPGRWDDVRKPNKAELAQTAVCSVDIEDASAKVRTGPPGDEPEDYDLPIWAGVVAMQLQRMQAIPDPQLPGDIPLPGYLAESAG